MAKFQPFTPDPDVLTQRMMPEPAEPQVSAPAAASQRGAPSGEIPTTLDGITALRDRMFVEAAYRLLLGRDASSDEYASGIHQLRSGAKDKVDILGDLRYSPEGAQRAIEIPGLKWRYRLRRLGRGRGFGWVFRWMLTLARLPTLQQAAQRHQAEIEAASLIAEEHAAAIQRMSRELRTHVRGQQSALEALEQGLAALSDGVRELESGFEDRLQHLSTANVRVVELLQDLKSRPAPAAGDPGPPSPEPSTARSLPAVAPVSPPPVSEHDQWYLAFEDQFRGTREQIKRAQLVYMKYVELAGAGTVDAPILDIGCGRGEWLELLREHGCIARGVDMNEAMAAANRERGLDVVAGDALEYLAGLPAASLGMVTGFHIIEHLPFGQLIRLFDECLRALKPGGCILFETPNPENLVVSAYTFYFDPTHRNPLPPAMIEFAVRERGYKDVEILRLHPRSEAGADDVLLDKWFRGPTDYAVIGWKDGRPAAGTP